MSSGSLGRKRKGSVAENGAAVSAEPDIYALITAALTDTDLPPMPEPAAPPDPAAAFNPQRSARRRVDKTDAPEQGYRLTVKEMPSADRPREKMLAQGATALTDAELVAIILRTGTAGENVIDVAQRLLVSHGGLTGLARIGLDDLAAQPAMGPAKATQLKAALEIGRRLLMAQPEERMKISSPGDIANLLMLEMGPLEQEHLKVIILNTKNQILKIETLYRGTLNSSNVRIAEVFKEAIKQNAASLIVVHNHPSGDPTPSPDDIRLTEGLVEAGALLDIEMLDHLVIGERKWLSMRERRLGFRA